MKRRILFVDDEPRVLEALEDLLFTHRHKWDMVFATSGVTGLEHMKKAAFDVVISDIRMPEMDGATFLQHVKELHPETIRIVLSGQAEMETTLRTVDVAHQFLHKPSDAKQVERVVERAFELRAIISDRRINLVIGRLPNLPVLPRAFQQLREMMPDPRISMRDIARVVEQDIAISVKILQLVNSAFFGLGRRITTIENAVNYLGLGVLQKLVLATEVFRPRELDPSSGIDLEALQNHSLLTAAIAAKLHLGSQLESEDAWAAGLFHDIGKLVLAAEVPQHFREASVLASESGIPLWMAEKQVHGFSHSEAGAYLLGLWGLPYPVAEAVAYHHEPSRLAHPKFDVLTAVHVANGLAHEIEAGSAAPESRIDMDYLATLGMEGALDGWREIAGSVREPMAK